MCADLLDGLNDQNDGTTFNLYLVSYVLVIASVLEARVAGSGAGLPKTSLII